MQDNIFILEYTSANLRSTLKVRELPSMKKTNFFVFYKTSTNLSYVVNTPYSYSKMELSILDSYGNIRKDIDDFIIFVEDSNKILGKMLNISTTLTIEEMQTLLNRKVNNSPRVYKFSEFRSRCMYLKKAFKQLSEPAEMFASIDIEGLSWNTVQTKWKRKLIIEFKNSNTENRFLVYSYDGGTVCGLNGEPVIFLGFSKLRLTDFYFDEESKRYFIEMDSLFDISVDLDGNVYVRKDTEVITKLVNFNQVFMHKEW